VQVERQTHLFRGVCLIFVLHHEVGQTQFMVAIHLDGYVSSCVTIPIDRYDGIMTIKNCRSTMRSGRRSHKKPGTKVPGFAF